MNLGVRRRFMKFGHSAVHFLSSAYKPTAAGAFILAAVVFVGNKVFGIEPEAMKNLIVVLLILMILLFLFFVAFPVYWGNWRHRTKSRNPNLRWLEYSVRLIFRENSEVHYYCEFVCAPIEVNIEYFTKRITWSGPVDAIQVISSYGGSVEFRRVEERSGTDCLFRFNPIPLKGKEISFGFKVAFKDEQNLIRNYIGESSTYMPERKLELFLKDERSDAGAFSKAIYSSISEVTPETREVTVASDSECHWVVDNPEHGKAYILRIGDNGTPAH